jgi:arylsulfatase A-like enzyme
MIELTHKNEPVMPNALEFASKSAFFTNAFANAPSTHFAVPSIMTGILPYTISDSQGIAQSVLYLPSLLKNIDFFNVGITTNVVTSRAYGYMRGFDYFEDFIKISDRSKNIKERKFRYLLEKLSPKSKKIAKFSLYPLYLLYKRIINNPPWPM